MLKVETIYKEEDVIIFIVPSNGLDREILKTVKTDSILTVVSITGAQYHGKAVPEGTIIISPKTIVLEQGEKINNEKEI